MVIMAIMILMLKGVAGIIFTDISLQRKGIKTPL